MIPCYVIAVLVVAVILICAVVLMVIVNLPRDETPKLLSTTSTTPSPTHIPEVNYRLPLNIRPINYNIDLRPYFNESDLRKFTFDGECFIEIQALQNTSQIQLHIMNLNISLSEYYKKNTTEKTVLPEATPNSLTDIVVYNLNEELQANFSYILHYKYTGSINEDVGGFYRSKYKTSDNVTKWFGAAQFQPTDARRVFPSFDEPNFKATFKLKITHDIELQSMGPTAVTLIMNRHKTKTVFFATTPIMSTYRLTFTVSEFYFRFDGQLGVIARPEYSSQTNYSYNIGKSFLTAFNEYFNESVSAINPNQIHLDAVPNSELGESLLLYDEKQSTLNSQQVVANIVAYQVAHLWWGNLVTCKWWSDTWLNEGFANYFQYFGTELVTNSFNMRRQFVVNVIQTVMQTDATNDTSPMSQKYTRTKADIELMFSTISYKKGAAFIRMTKHILGEQMFKKSLNIYLKTHAYKNTIPSDLFTIWKDNCPVEYRAYLTSYFKSFTTQVGYPVVTFNRTSNSTVEVTQKRFLLKDFDTADPKLTYTVPITFTTSSKNNFVKTYPRFFLQDYPFSIPVSKNVSWVIGNLQGTGYYRANYDYNSWNEIGKKLFSESREDIHEFNRAQIVDDLLNLARAGEIEHSVALNILQYLAFENNYLPWTAAFNGFSYIMTRLGNETSIFAPFIRDIIIVPYNKLGFEEKNWDSTFDIYNRANILAWSCQYGLPGCTTKAKSYFDEKIETNSVPVNIRSVVYCNVVREGNESYFNTLYKKYMTEIVASEKVLILDSLGCVKEGKLVDKFFQIIISDAVHPADKYIALCNLCTKNNENVDLVFDLIDKNIEQLAKVIGGYSSVASVVFDIAEHFTTEAQLKKLQEDFNYKYIDKFGSSNYILQTAVKHVEFNLKWSKGNLEKIKSFMNKYLQKNHAWRHKLLYS